MESSLYDSACERYEDEKLDHLPEALQRNSLDYYYLSVYPSLKGMQTLDGDDTLLPAYPDSMQSAYIHIPFCSGVCDFCSYYVNTVRPEQTERIDHYLELVKREIDYHRERTALQIGYLYMGGGTPSLIPPDTLKRFFGHLSEKSILAPEVQGTLELHPEFFRQRQIAQQFLDTLKEHGIGRVSLGLQSVSDEVLAGNNRRHEAHFFQDAVDFLKSKEFCVNVDVMYGLPGLTFAQWENTLNTALASNPDSISTYFLFVDPGTKTWHDVQTGRVVLPNHRDLQIQHIMAQTLLGQNGFHELPSDFYSKVQGDPRGFTQQALPSNSRSLPLGAGAYGFFDGTQFYNEFDLKSYEAKIISGRSPIWRGHKLNADSQLRRDIMFSFKNAPELRKELFDKKYGKSPTDCFPSIFTELIGQGLVQETALTLQLTSKGRLCVEEICALFGDPDLLSKGDPGRSRSETHKLEKHNFSPTLRRPKPSSKQNNG